VRRTRAPQAPRVIDGFAKGHPLQAGEVDGIDDGRLSTDESDVIPHGRQVGRFVGGELSGMLLI
jgi:hypothetical protein